MQGLGFVPPRCLSSPLASQRTCDLSLRSTTELITETPEPYCSKPVLPKPQPKTNKYTRQDPRFWLYTPPSMCMHIHTYVSIYINTCLHVCIYIYICIHTCMHIYIYTICVYIYICIHTYTYTYYQPQAETLPRPGDITSAGCGAPSSQERTSCLDFRRRFYGIGI